MFDSVLLFKNFYTNFLNKVVLKAPDFHDTAILANLNHISPLYHAELQEPVKFAYKLSKKILNPRPIERCNVMLAESVFHESIIAALRFYSSQHPEWNSTANYLEISKWWAIKNVRTTSIGKGRGMSGKCTFPVQTRRTFSSYQHLLVGLRSGKRKKRRTAVYHETFLCAIQTS